MDGVYDHMGRLDRARTDFLIGNDYVLKTAQATPMNFLPASRSTLSGRMRSKKCTVAQTPEPHWWSPTALQPWSLLCLRRNPPKRVLLRQGFGGHPLRIPPQLDSCGFLRRRVKVLPNAQQFNPSDPRYTVFYRTLAERKLPFLSHVGYEFSLIGKDQSVGDPDRLRLALDEGVTVIAAHACSYGLMLYEKFIPTFHEFAKRYPNFYADISALTLPNRMRMLLHLRHYPEIHERLLFGTDYPLSVFHIAAWGRVAFGTLRKMIRTKNRFDRQVEVCHGLKLSFRSLGDLLPQPTAKTMP